MMQTTSPRPIAAFSRIITRAYCAFKFSRRHVKSFTVKITLSPVGGLPAVLRHDSNTPNFLCKLVQLLL